MVPFSFSGVELMALPQGALFWPARRALLVADLHLEKASFFARFGQLLPPYDSDATLAELEKLALATGARALWCLGDSFHDSDGAQRLGGRALQRLERMTATLDWTWVTGNHDRLVAPPGGGRVVAEALVDGLCLRHEAVPGDVRPELSGHWHPKLRVSVRGRRVTRRCFVLSASKLVLPAFGALTGGMDAADPVVLNAVGRPAEALVVTAQRLLRFPLAG